MAPPYPYRAFLRARDELCAKTFVETGTYHGAIPLWASDHFDEVYTIEASSELWLSLDKRDPKVKFLLGDSGVVLRDLVPNLGSSVFWLDAHYSGPGTNRGGGECPLLAELDAISKSLMKHRVFIDDVRLFSGQLGPELTPADWPTIKQVREFPGLKVLADHGDILEMERC